jgi:hypothetical protein
MCNGVPAPAQPDLGPPNHPNHPLPTPQVPCLIFKRFVVLLLALPLFLATLPIAVPVAGAIAAACTTLQARRRRAALAAAASAGPAVLRLRRSRARSSATHRAPLPLAFPPSPRRAAGRQGAVDHVHAAAVAPLLHVQVGQGALLVGPGTGARRAAPPRQGPVLTSAPRGRRPARSLPPPPQTQLRHPFPPLKATCIVSHVLVMDTLLPFLVPLRFSILAALVPKAILA